MMLNMSPFDLFDLWAQVRGAGAVPLKLQLRGIAIAQLGRHSDGLGSATERGSSWREFLRDLRGNSSEDA